MSEDCPGKIAFENPFATAGAISWSELASGDPAASKSFYGDLFGWKYEDMDMPMGTYTCIMVDGVRMGGIMKSPCPEGTTMWSSYVTVADVEATFAKVTALGGKPLTEVMEVPGVGKMFFFEDPQGGKISAIEYAMTEPKSAD